LSSVDLCFSFGGGGQKNEHFIAKRKRKNQVPHCFDSCEVQWGCLGSCPAWDGKAITHHESGGRKNSPTNKLTHKQVIAPSNLQLVM